MAPDVRGTTHKGFKILACMAERAQTMDTSITSSGHNFASIKKQNRAAK